jgi:hypothetical protein
MRFNIQLDKVEKINPLFSKAKVRVLYVGLNRNNSYISKEAVEKAIPSLFNIPIVGEYLEEKDNFGSHGGKLEISEDDIKYIQTTKPYGVVAESAEIYWETVEESDGTINEYLIVDGAYLWTGRYEELNNILEKQYGQSMEIEVQDGEFAVVDGHETFKIDNFLFSALCILGVDKDGEGHVEPCFESASITAYTLDKDEFKSQFSQMMEELKYSLNEGGNSMPEENKENVEQVEEKFEETEVVEEETVNKEVADETVEIENNEEVSEEEEVEEINYQVKFEELEKEYMILKDNYSKLEEEVGSLREFKQNKLTEERKEAESELFESFSSELTEDEMKELKETSADFSLEDLEGKLYALVGKKKATFSKQPKKEKKPVKIEFEEKKEEFTPYGGLLDKYSN